MYLSWSVYARVGEECSFPLLTYRKVMSAGSILIMAVNNICVYLSLSKSGDQFPLSRSLTVNNTSRRGGCSQVVMSPQNFLRVLARVLVAKTLCKWRAVRY
jgi:hypothetical protein